MLRSALTGLTAGVIAVISGLLGAWATSRYLLDLDRFSVIWPSALLILTGGLLANFVAVLSFSLHALGTRPSRVLRAAD